MIKKKCFDCIFNRKIMKLVRAECVRCPWLQAETIGGRLEGVYKKKRSIFSKALTLDMKLNSLERW